MATEKAEDKDIKKALLIIRLAQSVEISGALKIADVVEGTFRPIRSSVGPRDGRSSLNSS